MSHIKRAHTFPFCCDVCNVLDVTLAWSCTRLRLHPNFTDVSLKLLKAVVRHLLCTQWNYRLPRPALESCHCRGLVYKKFQYMFVRVLGMNFQWSCASVQCHLAVALDVSISSTNISSLIVFQTFRVKIKAASTSKQYIECLQICVQLSLLHSCRNTMTKHRECSCTKRFATHCSIWCLDAHRSNPQTFELLTPAAPKINFYKMHAWCCDWVCDKDLQKGTNVDKNKDNDCTLLEVHGKAYQ